MTSEERTTRVLNIIVFCMFLGMAVTLVGWDFPQRTSTVMAIYRSLADQDRRHLVSFFSSLVRLMALLAFAATIAARLRQKSPGAAN